MMLAEDVDQVNRAMLEKLQKNPLKSVGKYSTSAQEVGHYQRGREQIY